MIAFVAGAIAGAAALVLGVLWTLRRAFAHRFAARHCEICDRVADVVVVYLEFRPNQRPDMRDVLVCECCAFFYRTSDSKPPWASSPATSSSSSS